MTARRPTVEDAPAHRDIVVVGASEGGTEALSAFVAGLPVDLPAAVFVTLHSHASSESRLPEILTRHGALRARHAIHGERIAAGRIYVAPPDNHLMLRPGYVQVVRGPKENGFRPSV
ncbi:MAG TPA: chemotaxis protein CheB, partial [Polyangia bacterium]|nr:chemotaxis protein CheB [Polyangia bacterium]